MELDWILLGLLGWAVAIVLAFALMHMAGRQDDLARRAEMENGLGSESPFPEPDARTRREDVRRVSTDGPHHRSGQRNRSTS